VSGREFDSSDVVATMKYYVALAATSPNNSVSSFNQLNPFAPIESVEAPDKYTVVFKLKTPSSYLMHRFANMITGELGTITPRETGDTFDPKKDQIGTGGFIRESFEPSVKTVYKRNPEYFEKGLPYIDRVEIPVLPEYQAQIAQFRTGNFLTVPRVGNRAGVRATDILPLKKELPDLAMYKQLEVTSNPGRVFGFGWLPIGGEKSPFLDKRVRQALAMALDREAYIDTFYEVGNYEAAGLPMETFYFTQIGYIPEVTLDPRDEKSFGENAKYYKHSPADAKALLAAARPNGMPEHPSHVVNIVFGPDYVRQCEVADTMARDVGFKPKTNPIDYNQFYLPKIVTQRGKFEGWAHRIGAVSSEDPVDFFLWRYYSKAGNTSGALGFDAKGVGDDSGDPAVDALIEKAIGEFDQKKRLEHLWAIQRYLAAEQYGVYHPGIATIYELAWPALGNHQVFQNESRVINQQFYSWWIDDSKPPLKKA
jgi:ABC-type transport system substrate-binding protein